MPWKIIISGDGPMYNDANAGDVDRLAARLVRELRSAHHTVSEASFDDGTNVLQLLNPDIHILARDAVEAEFRRKQEEAEREQRRQEEQQRKLLEAGGPPNAPPGI